MKQKENMYGFILITFMFIKNTFMIAIFEKKKVKI